MVITIANPVLNPFDPCADPIRLPIDGGTSGEMIMTRLWHDIASSSMERR